MSLRLLPSLLSSLLLLCVSCERSSKPPAVVVEAFGPRTLIELKQRITCGAGGPSGQIAGGTAAGKVFWARVGGSPRALVSPKPLHDGPIAALDYSADGTHLLSAGGKVVAYWEVGSGKLLRQVAGPQRVTSAALTAGAGEAYFGTDQGHVLRWRLDQPGADGVKAFSCGGARVHPARMNLPEPKRCPYGTYLETDAGLHVCLYPVTHLSVGQGILLRACRSGTLGFLDLKRLTTSYFQAGHLGVLVPVGADQALLGRVDGQVRLHRRTESEPRRTFSPAAPAPTAAAAAGSLGAVATRGRILIWHLDHEQQACALSLPAGRRAIWIGLDGGAVPNALRALYDDGALVSFKLAIRRRGG